MAVAAPSDAAFERILEACGGFGLYQLLLILLQHNIMEMFVDQNLASMVFNVAAPKWACPDDNGTDWAANSTAVRYYGIEERGRCDAFANCTDGDMVFQEDINTIATEFGLYCGQSWVGEFLTTLQTLGSLCGALVMAQLAESFGRKPVAAVCYVSTAAIGMATSMVGSWRLVAVLMFASGATASGWWTASFVLMQEVMLPRHRLIAWLFHGWHLNGFLLVFNMWYLHDWRRILFWTNACALPLVLLYMWLVGESPRWLMQHGYKGRARAAFGHIAAVNRRRPAASDGGGEKVSEQVEKLLEAQEESAAGDGGKVIDKRRQHYTYWDLFRTPRMAMLSIVMIYSWFACSHVSYGLFFNVKSLPGNRVTNQLTVTLLNFVSNYSIFVTDRCFGRKAHHQISLLAMTGSMLVVSVLYFQPDWPHRDTLMTFFAILGQGVNCACWMCIYMYSAELYPTVLRSLGNGAGSVAARVGGALAPTVLYLGQFWGFLPYAIWMGLLLVNAALAAAFMPETKGRPLPEVVPQRDWSCCRGGTRGSSSGSDGGEQDSDAVVKPVDL